MVPGKPWKVTLSPGTAPHGGSRISTLSGELAHMTVAWDTTPVILAGFMLHSRTAMRFCICTRDRRLNIFSNLHEENKNTSNWYSHNSANANPFIHNNCVRGLWFVCLIHKPKGANRRPLNSAAYQNPLPKAQKKRNPVFHDMMYAGS